MTIYLPNGMLQPYPNGDKWRSRINEDDVLIEPKYDEMKNFLDDPSCSC